MGLRKKGKAKDESLANTSKVISQKKIVEPKKPRRKSKAEYLEETILNADQGLPERVNTPEDAVSIERVNLSLIRLDETNSRTKYLDILHPKKNPFSEEHPRFKEYEDLINGLILFAEHLKTEPLRQPITLYTHNNKYYVAHGNRRFLAMLISHEGHDYSPICRVLKSKPDDLGISRFQENSQREDLPLLTLIEEFQLAYSEIELRKSELSSQKVGDCLGISKSQAWRLQMCSKNDDLLELLNEGIDIPKSAIKHIAKGGRAEILDYLSSKNNVKVSKKPKTSKSSGGRTKTIVTFPKQVQKDPELFKKIFKGEFADRFNDDDFVTVENLVNKIKEIFQDEV